MAFSSRKVTSIGELAFADSYRLEEVTIPENVNFIGKDAFYSDRYRRLKEIHIPSKVTDEIEGAPWGANYAAIYWKDVVKADPYAFNPTTNTIVRYIGNGGDLVIPSAITINGVNHDVLHIGKGAFLNVLNVTSVEIPDSIQTIGEAAFSKNSLEGKRCQLKRVIIGNGITSIPQDAFKNSFKLEEVQLGDNVEVIDHEAFAHAEALKEIHLPNTLKTIGSDVFFGTSLTAIDIPDSVESIGEDTFSDTGISEIHIPSKVTNTIKNAPWGADDAIIFWKGVEQIGDYIFDSNTSTIVRYVGIGGSVDIPNSFYINQQEYPVTTIGAKAFKNTSLTEVNIPDNVTAIYYEAFADNNLTQATIGKQIQSIDSTAFSRNPNMTHIILDVVRDSNGTLQNGQPWGAPVNVTTKYRGEFVSFNSVVELVPGEYKRNIKIQAMIENGALINEITLPDGKKVNVGKNHWPSANSYEEYIVNQPGIYTFKGRDNNSFEVSYKVDVSDIGRPTVSATNATVKLDELGALTEQNLLNKVNASATTLELGNDFSGGSFSISPSDLDKVKAMTNVGEEVRIRVIATSPTRLTDSIEVVITAVIDEVNISFVDYDNKLISQSIMKIGDALQAPTDPSRLGYDFAGWNPTIPANVPNQDTIYKATYTPKSDTVYMIDYVLLDVDFNIVEVTRDTLEGDTDAMITITPKDIKGYVYDPNHVDNKVSGVIDANNPTVFKLHYNQDENNNDKPDFEEFFNVSFHDYDGTLIQQNNFDNPQSVMYGKAANEPIAPTRPNYTFTGWDKTFDKVTQDLVITATYRSNSSGGGGGTTPPVVPPVTPPTTPEVKPEVTPPGTPEVKPEVKPEIKPETKPEGTLPPSTPSNPNPPVETTPEVNITVTPENSNSTANKGETTTPEKDNNKDLDAKEKDKDLMQPEFGDTQKNNCVLHWFMWLIALIMSALIVFKRNKNKKEVEAIVGRSED